MVELKAVGPGFPYYGTLRLQGGAPYAHAPGRRLRRAGAAGTARATRRLAVGDRIAMGGREFTVRGVIEAEPGRRLGAFSLGPRVIVDIADLEQTSLVAFGSRVTHQRLVKIARRRPAGAAGGAARRRQEQLRARALVPRHRRRHGRGLRPRRELPEPGGPGGGHSRRRGRVERDARVRAAEAEEHRHPEVSRRARRAGAGDLRRPGARARRCSAASSACCIAAGGHGVDSGLAGTGRDRRSRRELPAHALGRARRARARACSCRCCSRSCRCSTCAM